MLLDQVTKLAEKLPVIDKVRLIERIAPQIEHDLQGRQPAQRRSLWGLCADLGVAPSGEVIDQARSEEWVSFPREDI
ncbi:MAG: hypothetical protein HY784_05025 [Chloroflexi bacterium]|nr:hypothetical protein [Chloroflexota bacterium]